MERSQDGGGVRADAKAVRRFSALEFIGHTTMGNDQLDIIRKMAIAITD
jgi:hypothetical protein